MKTNQRILVNTRESKKFESIYYNTKTQILSFKTKTGQKLVFKNIPSMFAKHILMPDDGNVDKAYNAFQHFMSDTKKDLEMAVMEIMNTKK